MMRSSGKEEKMKRYLVTALAFLVIMVGISYAQTTIYVDCNSTSDTEDGTVDFPYKKIQDGIEAASAGYTVSVAAGTYSPSTNGEVFPINMKNGVNLIGAGKNDCILDAEDTNRVIRCIDISIATTKIEGFTITGGNYTDLAWGYGGGIYCEYSSLIISNNIISGNTARWGGGIGCWGSINILLSLTISNNTISGNSVIKNGGAIYCREYSPTIKNNTILGNNADKGGGITLSTSSHPDIANNVILLNEAVNFAGGIQIASSSPYITNNTITGNSAPNYAGGVYSYSGSLPTIVNCIIWGNLGNGIDLYGWDASFSCIGTIVSGTPGPGTISIDPSFAGDGFHISSVSECIDAGNSTAVPSWLDKDYDGQNRICGLAVDMGADEYCGATDVIIASVDIDPNTLNLKSKGKWITVYIELPESNDVAEISIDSISIEGAVFAEPKPSSIGDNDNDGIPDLMVKFARSDIEDYITNILSVTDGEVTLMITGEVGQDSTPFQGEDTIRVIKKGK
jgi:predicted outer membrane repeat protein